MDREYKKILSVDDLNDGDIYRLFLRARLFKRQGITKE